MNPETNILDRIEATAEKEHEKGVAKIVAADKVKHPWPLRRVLRYIRNAYRHLVWWHPWSAMNWWETIGEAWMRNRKGYDWRMVGSWHVEMADLIIVTLREYRDHPMRGIGGSGFIRPLIDDDDPDPDVRAALDEHTAVINEIIDGFRALKVLSDLSYMGLFHDRFQSAKNKSEQDAIQDEVEEVRKELQSKFERALDLLKEHWEGIWV